MYLPRASAFGCEGSGFQPIKYTICGGGKTQDAEQCQWLRSGDDHKWRARARSIGVVARSEGRAAHEGHASVARNIPVTTSGCQMRCGANNHDLDGGWDSIWSVLVFRVLTCHTSSDEGDSPNSVRV